MKFWSHVALASFLCLLPVTARGAVEQQLLGTIKLDAVPLDVALSPEEGKVFVLLEGGRVEVYSGQGALLDSLTVEGEPDRLSLTPSGDVLVLGSSSAREVRLVRLDFLQTFATEGSPSKGPAEATVEIVVFNDFQ